MLGGSISYYILHFITFVIVCMIDYEVFGKEIDFEFSCPVIYFSFTYLKKLLTFSEDQLILKQDFIVWINFSKINVLR